MSKDFTWIAHIPLIGGLPIGAEMAFGKGPEFVASLPGFNGNDSQYMNYLNNTMGRDTKYVVIQPEDLKFERKINVIVSTPPLSVAA